MLWAGAHARRLLGGVVRGRSLAITACQPQRSAALEPEMRPYKAARTRPLPSPLLDRDKCLLPVPAQHVGAVQQVGSSGSTTNSCREQRLTHHPSLMPRNHRPTAPRRPPNFYHRPFPIQMSGVLIQLTEDPIQPHSCGGINARCRVNNRCQQPLSPHGQSRKQIPSII